MLFWFTVYHMQKLTQEQVIRWCQGKYNINIGWKSNIDIGGKSKVDIGDKFNIYIKAKSTVEMGDINIELGEDLIQGTKLYCTEM